MAGGSSRAVVVVSPHFDDAVLSCWSVLNRHRENACVLTVFGGAPPAGRLWLEWDALAPGARDSATRVVQRRDENRLALATIGSTAIDLPLLENQYADLGGGRLDPATLRQYLIDAEGVYVTAGIGRNRSHPDHQTARDAVLKLRPDAVMYSDQPYCVFPRDLELAPAIEGYERDVVMLTGDEATRKTAAIACYAGEVQRMAGLKVRLEHPEEEFRYEVLWRPSARGAG